MISTVSLINCIKLCLQYPLILECWEIKIQFEPKCWGWFFSIYYWKWFFFPDKTFSHVPDDEVHCWKMLAISISETVDNITSGVFSTYFESTIFRISCTNLVNLFRRCTFQDVDRYSCTDISVLSVNWIRIKDTTANILINWSCPGILLTNVCSHFTGVIPKSSQERTHTLERLKGKMLICKQKTITDRCNLNYALGRLIYTIHQVFLELLHGVWSTHVSTFTMQIGRT